MGAVWFSVGAVLAGIGVGLGAFGAHGLRDRLSPELLAIWETGVRYHLVHALGLIAAAWASERWPGAWPAAAGWSFLTGIAVFSGSLYALALSGARWLGAITPIGGLAFLAGWVALALAGHRGG